MEKFVVDGLRASLPDRVITGADAGYDEARATFNATIVRRPAVIVRARSVEDVVAAVIAAGDLGIADRGPRRRPQRRRPFDGRSAPWSSTCARCAR